MKGEGERKDNKRIEDGGRRKGLRREEENGLKREKGSRWYDGKRILEGGRRKNKGIW
jgi:hypothetical protein